MAAGLTAAGGVAAVIGGLLFEVSPGDPGLYLAVTLLLAAVGAGACCGRARRAANRDPLVVLRGD
jgi:hypothetical protein